MIWKAILNAEKILSCPQKKQIWAYLSYRYQNSH